MGRRKLEMKRIEGKSSRIVSFCKRRSGLIKKARHLSLLCDADVALIAFSNGGKLYEFSSDSSSTTTNSVERILSRYEKSCLEAGEMPTQRASKDLEPLLQCKRFRAVKELLEAVDRLAEPNNAKELSVKDMIQLEEELGAALMQTRLRKTQLMMEHISTLQEKENKMTEEIQELEKQVAASVIQESDEDDVATTSVPAYFAAK